jgi:2-polyprenyl-3-methyl-5-hydroxy-6-metoxy-1,4-benzoquinol methylase
MPKIIRKIYRKLKRLFWAQKIKKALANIDETKTKNWWDKEFFYNLVSHSHQNILISSDFLKNSSTHPSFLKIFQTSSRCLDFGCGTGEMAHLLHKKYGLTVTSVDVSDLAIRTALNLYASNKVHFQTISPDSSLEELGLFDFVICSNTLEHFRNPYIIIEKLFKISPFVIIIVPYGQPAVDNYEYEGGAAHAFTFHEESFNKYHIIDSFKFRSLGWDYSSAGETPQQLAVLIEIK